MRPEDIKKLVGGYAAGNLTPEEQQALFAAALEDQELFDALAREQSLRDLLKDPAARGELLAALDRPAGGLAAFWQWLRQPMVAGVVTTCFLAVAVTAVWRAMHPVPNGYLTVEVLQDAPRPSAAAPVTTAPVIPAPGAPQSVPAGQQGAESRRRAFDAVASAPSGSGGGARVPVEALEKSKAEFDMPAKKEMAAAPPPPPLAAAAPQPLPSATATPVMVATGARQAKVQESVQVQAENAQLATALTQADARSLFYQNSLATGVSGFVDAAGAGGGAARTTLAAPAKAPDTRLGVRVSILRGDQEVDTTTVLNSGESVRLKLIPNIDGFLSVTEGTRAIAGASVRRLVPFETPAIAFEAGGPRQLVITLSRTPLSGAANRADAAARGNLVEPAADQGRATYVVSNVLQDGSQVVVPLTLNYK